MLSDKKEIEIIFKNAEQILIDKPELAEMNLEDVINALDGNERMIRDRWGVAALLVIKSISKWELHDIVEQLSSVESCDLTYEFVGYLLQTQYDIDMEALLLEADKQNKFDCIVKYVKANLRFLTEIKQQYISPSFQMLDRHTDNEFYITIVSNYVKSIADCNAFLIITKSFGELKNRAEYDLMSLMGREWYRKDSIEANQTLDILLGYENIWSKKVSIDFIENSLYCDSTAFERYFPKIEEMILKNNDLWLQAIAVFVKYVMLYPEGANTNQFYGKVMEHLKRLPTDSTKAKCNFLATLQFEKDITQDIQDVFQEIILNPFEVNQCPLQILDHILYNLYKNSGLDIVMKYMLEIFRINGYRYKHTSFFDGLNLIVSELNKDAEKIFRLVITYMLSNDIYQVFFGLGWLMIVGVIYNEDGNNLRLSNDQLIRILKATLYFSVDNSKTCKIAFQLLNFIDETPDKYITFCMDDLYKNYPGTMLKVSKQFITSDVDLQVQLAELVSKAHEKTVQEYELCLKIKDLRPSEEHQYIYRKALQEQNKQINKKAHEKSIFASFFSTKTLKYGVRNAHIVKGVRGEKSYQSSPYQYFKQEMELPGLYVEDPVGFAMKKQAFLDEVISSALDN